MSAKGIKAGPESMQSRVQLATLLFFSPLAHPHCIRNASPLCIFPLHHPRGPGRPKDRAFLLGVIDNISFIYRLYFFEDRRRAARQADRHCGMWSPSHGHVN